MKEQQSNGLKWYQLHMLCFCFGWTATQAIAVFSGDSSHAKIRALEKRISAIEQQALERSAKK